MPSPNSPLLNPCQAGQHWSLRRHQLHTDVLRSAGKDRASSFMLFDTIMEWRLVAPPVLTNWGRDRMVAIFQTAFSNAFYWIQNIVLWWNFHYKLFPRVQVTIFQHWFRQWLGVGQADAFMRHSAAKNYMLRSIDRYTHQWNGLSLVYPMPRLCQFIVIWTPINILNEVWITIQKFHQWWDQVPIKMLHCGFANEVAFWNYDSYESNVMNMNDHMNFEKLSAWQFNELIKSMPRSLGSHPINCLASESMGLLSLTCINNIDDWLYSLQSMGWNYFSIPKLWRSNRWILGMGK